MTDEQKKTYPYAMMNKGYDDDGDMRFIAQITLEPKIYNRGQCKNLALIWAIENDVNVENIDLSWADLYCMDLSGVSLRGVDLTSASCIRTNFTGADLTDANFSRSHSHSSNFTDAKLKGVQFSNTDLENANFTGADLTNANFTDAVFAYANLKNAIFTNADLTNTKFMVATEGVQSVDRAAILNVLISERELSLMRKELDELREFKRNIEKIIEKQYNATITHLSNEIEGFKNLINIAKEDGGEHSKEEIEDFRRVIRSYKRKKIKFEEAGTKKFIDIIDFKMGYAHNALANSV